MHRLKRQLGIVLLIAATLMTSATAALCETSQRDVAALAKANLIYVATVRKDGNQSTSAPVWFTTTADHVVLIQTAPTTWKAKRIKRGSAVVVWIGDEDGPAFLGKAEITGDPSVVKAIVDDFPKKYLMARVGIHKPTSDSFEKGTRLAIKITPLHDLPDGFASKPGKPAPK